MELFKASTQWNGQGNIAKESKQVIMQIVLEKESMRQFMNCEHQGVINGATPEE